MGFTLFKWQPTSEKVRQFLGRVIAQAGIAPKYLITDSGVQFTAAGFRPWCRRQKIRQRKGAVGQTGSIAVVERFILSLKNEGTRLLSFIPLTRRAFQRELKFYFAWFNSDRPHTTLKGATPDEVYFGRRPACRAPRFEPRAAWPRGSPCAAPKTLVKGQPGAKFTLTIDFIANRRHLPHIRLTCAA